MFIRLTNGKPETYTIGQLRRDNPQTSFPKHPSDELLAEWNVYSCVQQDLPAYDHLTEKVSEGPIEQINGVWTRTWAVEQLPEEEASERKKREIKARRDEAINAGTTVNGVSVATDDISQQRITGAALAVQIDPTTTVNWKMPDGTFTTLTSTQIIAIAQAVRAHIQACFDREAELLNALATDQPYDLTTGWP